MGYTISYVLEKPSKASVTPLSIDVFSDVVCPWCFIGSRRLSQALSTLGDKVEAKVVYHPFLLDPTTPPEGRDLREHLQGKFGRDPVRIFGTVEAAAQSSGIPLDFTKVLRYSNTLGAHTLIRHALTKGTQLPLVGALFSAYFLESRDVGNPDVLVDIAAKHGFAAEEARALLTHESELAQTSHEAEQALAMGIRGVPFFIFAKRVAFSGAHPPETFVSAIEKALEENAGG